MLGWHESYVIFEVYTETHKQFTKTQMLILPFAVETVYIRHIDYLYVVWHMRGQGETVEWQQNWVCVTSQTGWTRLRGFPPLQVYPRWSVTVSIRLTGSQWPLCHKKQAILSALHHSRRVTRFHLKVEPSHLLFVCFLYFITTLMGLTRW